MVRFSLYERMKRTVLRWRSRDALLCLRQIRREGRMNHISNPVSKEYPFKNRSFSWSKLADLQLVVGLP